MLEGKQHISAGEALKRCGKWYLLEIQDEEYLELAEIITGEFEQLEMELEVEQV